MFTYRWWQVGKDAINYNFLATIEIHRTSVCQGCVHLSLITREGSTLLPYVDSLKSWIIPLVYIAVFISAFGQDGNIYYPESKWWVNSHFVLLLPLCLQPPFSLWLHPNTHKGKWRNIYVLNEHESNWFIIQSCHKDVYIVIYETFWIMQVAYAI